MRLFTLVAICVGALSAASLASATLRTSARPGAPELSPNSLREIGITGASDIESALIKYPRGNAYLLTYKDTPELASRLYRALYDLGPYNGSIIPADGTTGVLMLTPTNGQPVYLPFKCEDAWQDGRENCYIDGDKQSYALDQLLDDIKRNAKAAEQGSRIGKYDVREAEIRLPGKRPVRIRLPSKEATALVNTAKAIVDSLDMRTPVTEKLEEIGQAQHKYGSVALLLEYPITLRLYELVNKTGRGKEPVFLGGFCVNMRVKEVYCDALVVMDYGNYIPPVVLIRDRIRDYYLYDELTRRTQEREGVEKYGLPGPPLSNKTYYKSPKDLYLELRGLAEKAYKFGTPWGY